MFSHLSRCCNYGFTAETRVVTEKLDTLVEQVMISKVKEGKRKDSFLEFFRKCKEEGRKYNSKRF